LCEDWELDSEQPQDLVGETVRSLWLARGGESFWHDEAYETSWCPCAQIFRDLKCVPIVRRKCQGQRQLRTGFQRLTPRTRLAELLDRRDEADLLQAIRTRFGVRVGRYEAGWEVLVAGALVSPLGLLVGACVGFSLFEEETVSRSLVAFGTYAAGWLGAIRLYARSQPRLSPHLQTVKDLVREIVEQRRHGTRPRVRPIFAA